MKLLKKLKSELEPEGSDSDVELVSSHSGRHLQDQGWYTGYERERGGCLVCYGLVMGLYMGMIWACVWALYGHSCGHDMGMYGACCGLVCVCVCVCVCVFVYHLSLHYMISFS